jgi:hypothetical protein
LETGGDGGCDNEDEKVNEIVSNDLDSNIFQKGYDDVIPYFG